MEKTIHVGNYLWVNDLQTLLTSMLESDVQKRPEDVMVIQQELQRIVAQQEQEQGNHVPLDSPAWTLFRNDQTWTRLPPAQMQAPDLPSLPPSVTYRDIELPTRPPKNPSQCISSLSIILIPRDDWSAVAGGDNGPVFLVMT